MNGVRWIAAMALCEDDIQSIEPNFITATLKNGSKISVPIYMVDEEHMKAFDYRKALEAYNKVNGIEKEEYHGAD